MRRPDHCLQTSPSKADKLLFQLIRLSGLESLLLESLHFCYNLAFALHPLQCMHGVSARRCSFCCHLQAPETFSNIMTDLHELHLCTKKNMSGCTGILQAKTAHIDDIRQPPVSVESTGTGAMLNHARDQPPLPPPDTCAANVEFCKSIIV